LVNFYHYSLEYNDERIENTYLWIKATHNSKIIMNIWIRIINNNIELKFKSVINKWPAIKFAVNRIDSERGRIIILIVSIIVIKGAK
jgi:hypothetical protein